MDSNQLALFRSWVRVLNLSIWILSFGFLICFGLWISVSAATVDEKIGSAIKSYVIANHPEWKNEEVIINLDDNENILSNYRDSDILSVRIPSAYHLTKITPKLLIPLIIKTSQKSLTINLQARIEVYKDVVTAANKINKNSVISADSLSMSKKEIALLPAKYFTSADDVAGKAAKINISESSIVYDWMIKVVPIISKGDKIKISVSGNNLILETDGIALEDGQIGDKINVRRNDSGKNINATVINKNSVGVKL